MCRLRDSVCDARHVVSARQHLHHAALPTGSATAADAACSPPAPSTPGDRRHQHPQHLHAASPGSPPRSTTAICSARNPTARAARPVGVAPHPRARGAVLTPSDEVQRRSQVPSIHSPANDALHAMGESSADHRPSPIRAQRTHVPQLTAKLARQPRAELALAWARERESAIAPAPRPHEPRAAVCGRVPTTASDPSRTPTSTHTRPRARSLGRSAPRPSIIPVIASARRDPALVAHPRRDRRAHPARTTAPRRRDL